MTNITPELIMLFANNDIELKHIKKVNSSPDTFPCTYYVEAYNIDDTVGDTVSYSQISYDFHIYGKTLQSVSEEAIKIDGIMKSIHFNRTGYVEQTIDNLTRKVVTYSRTMKD